MAIVHVFAHQYDDISYKSDLNPILIMYVILHGILISEKNRFHAFIIKLNNPHCF